MFLNESAKLSHDIEETVCHTVTDDLMEKVSEMVDGFNESFNSYKKNTTDQIKTLQKISGESIDLKDRIQMLYSIVMKKPDATDLVAIYDRLKFMVTADKIEELEQNIEKRANLSNYEKTKKKLKAKTKMLEQEL